MKTRSGRTDKISGPTARHCKPVQRLPATGHQAAFPTVRTAASSGVLHCVDLLLLLLLVLSQSEVFPWQSQTRGAASSMCAVQLRSCPRGWKTLVTLYRLEGVGVMVHIDSSHSYPDPRGRTGPNGSDGSGAPAGIVILGATDDVELTLDDDAVELALEPVMVHELACACAFLRPEAEPRGKDAIICAVLRINSYLSSQKAEVSLLYLLPPF